MRDLLSSKEREIVEAVALAQAAAIKRTEQIDAIFGKAAVRREGENR